VGEEERERGIERESQRERQGDVCVCVFVSVCERESERERVCVCVCVRGWERESERYEERERGKYEGTVFIPATSSKFITHRAHWIWVCGTCGCVRMCVNVCAMCVSVSLCPCVSVCTTGKSAHVSWQRPSPSRPVCVCLCFCLYVLVLMQVSESAVVALCVSVLLYACMSCLCPTCCASGNIYMRISQLKFKKRQRHPPPFPPKNTYKHK